MKKYIKSLLDFRSVFSILFIVICVILNAVCSFYPLVIIQKMVDIAAGTGEFVISSILKLGGLYLTVQVLNSGFASLTVYFTESLQAKIALKAQLNLYQSLSRTRIQYIKNNHTSNLNNYLIKDTEYCAENMIQPFVRGFSAILRFGVGFYFMSRVNVYLTLIILPLGFFSSIIIDFIRKRTAENFVKQRDSMQQLWKTFSEGISAFLPIKLHRYVEPYYKKVESDGKKLAETQIRQSKLESLTKFWTSSLFMISIGVILIIASILVSKDMISIGGLTAILMYNHMLTDPLLEMVVINQDIAKLSICVKRLQNIMNLPKDENDLPFAQIDEVQLKKVSFSFEGQCVIREMDLSLKGPVSLAIFGESGIGKTTLANLITHVYLSSSGEVRYKFKGNAVSGLPRVSYLIQDEYLFDDTIKNNILVGNPNLSEEEYQDIIQDCCLERVVQNHRGNIGENGSLLSGGERKRVILARTLADFDADIFVFDELSASLDGSTFDDIFARVESRLKDKIRIYIEHNRTIEKQVDFNIFLDKDRHNVA